MNLSERIADKRCQILQGTRNLLEAENAALKQQIDKIGELHNKAMAENAALKRENEVLRGLLARYGKHDTDCKGVPLGIAIQECPCGLVPNVTHEVLKSQGGQILKDALLTAEEQGHE